MIRILTHSALGLLTVAVAACSSDDTVTLRAPATIGEMPPDGSLDRGMPVDDASESPLFAVGASVFGPEGNTSYVALLPSLDRTVEIDYGRVLEVGSASSIFGPERGSFFAVGLDEAPTITRYDITSDAQFVEGETLDLSAHGLGHMWRDPGLVPFLSSSKAYVIDATELQIVIWDPSAMRVLGSFALDGLTDADYPITRFEPAPTFRGDELLIVATHSTDATTAPFSTLISIDTKNDRLTRLVREERCGGLWDSVEASNGDIYFATGVWDAAQNRVLGSGVAAAPCIVRVEAGDAGFDPDFFLDPAGIGGYPAGGLVSGGGDVAFIKVLDEPALPTIRPEDFDAIWSGAVWQWWRFELGSPGAATPVTSLPLSNGGGGELVVDGKTYVRNAAADFSQTTLLDMSAEGDPIEQLTLRGYPYGIVRMR
jgi:hypothetical protein